MNKYIEEAAENTLKGIVTCGARAGYEGNKQFSLDDVIDFVARAHEQVPTPIPCIIREGTLMRRTDTTEYKEKIYTLEFLWSPRKAPLENDVFYARLLHYAQMLGTQMQQERVYVEFEGKTIVLKKTA